MLGRRLRFAHVRRSVLRRLRHPLNVARNRRRSSRRFRHIARHFAESWVYAAAGDESAADEARGRVLAYRQDYQYAVNVSLHDALCPVVKGGIAEGGRHASGGLSSMPPGFRSHMITETGKTVLRAMPIEKRQLPPVREFREVLTATAPGPRVLSSGA